MDDDDDRLEDGGACGADIKSYRGSSIRLLTLKQKWWGIKNSFPSVFGDIMRVASNVIR